MENTKIKITLRNNKDVSIKRFHPWIYSGAIQSVVGKPKDGDIVEVFDSQDNFLAIGHYQPDSIAVRVLSFEKREIDHDFWLEKIGNAIKLRRTLGFFENKETNVFRIINGEGDDLSGLIVDFYDGLLVIQCFSVGMFRQLEEITEAFKIELKNELKAIYNKSYLKLPRQFTDKKPDGYLWQTHDNLIKIIENGNVFLVDFINGQKSGFFIDQRKNRSFLSEFVKDKTVANLYGYTGGFSVYAAKSGAKKVVTVDSSEGALEIAKENYILNNVENIVENIESDVVKFLDDTDEKFDVIILDPPAFSKNHNHREKALRAYKKINSKALEKINEGGILFSFSCSKAVTANDLRQSIFVAAASMNKNLKILHQLHQPADHPISIFHPEGEHLKGFIVQVL